MLYTVCESFYPDKCFEFGTTRSLPLPYFSKTISFKTYYYWPAYTQYKGADYSIVTVANVCRRLSSVGVCNTPRRACRRLHPRRPTSLIIAPQRHGGPVVLRPVRAISYYMCAIWKESLHGHFTSMRRRLRRDGLSLETRSVAENIHQPPQFNSQTEKITSSRGKYMC